MRRIRKNPDPMHHHPPLLIHVVEDDKLFVRELDIFGRRQLVAEVVQPETIENEDGVALAAKRVGEQFGDEEGAFDTAFIP